MSMDKPFRVEVTVDAPRDEVWRALTEPERIRHWFGWDYDGLEDEIDLIFVKGATLVPPERIELGADGWIELIENGPRTVIRAVKPGDATGWEDVYGDIEEGWITFFNQLRHRIARHPTSSRRMIVLRGEAGLPPLPGEPWHESRYQRGADVDGELAIVFAKPGGEATLLVTTYDLGDQAFAAADERWRAWWSKQVTGRSAAVLRGGTGGMDFQIAVDSEEDEQSKHRSWGADDHQSAVGLTQAGMQSEQRTEPAAVHEGRAREVQPDLGGAVIASGFERLLQFGRAADVDLADGCEHRAAAHAVLVDAQ